jgi:hypothetical protein
MLSVTTEPASSTHGLSLVGERGGGGSRSKDCGYRTRKRARWHPPCCRCHLLAGIVFRCVADSDRGASGGAKASSGVEDPSSLARPSARMAPCRLPGQRERYETLGRPSVYGGGLRSGPPNGVHASNGRGEPLALLRYVFVPSDFCSRGEVLAMKTAGVLALLPPRLKDRNVH